MENDQDKSLDNLNIQTSSQSLDFAAYVIGGSILLGAIVISATVFYFAHKAEPFLQQLAANFPASAQTAQVPAAAVQNNQPAAAPSAPAGTPVKIVLKPNTPFLGSANAKVTVVEYADYQCPFCEKFFSGVMPVLKTKYISTGEIKFVYQDFAFLGPDSNTAAEASHCAADQNKFWQYHDYLFTNQGQEGSAWATADHQKQFAAAVGLNAAKFNQCLDSGKYKQEVLDETAAGKSYGVSGTPSVFVNGVIIVGAQPLASFEQAIDAALK